jgi:hypothetical protein
MTTPTPPLVLSGGSVVTGCTIQASPTLLWDVLHHFGFTESPSYHGRLYHEFVHGHCGVHVDIPPHPSHPSLTVWTTSTTGDDLDDTLERTAHQALMEFCERHL